MAAPPDDPVLEARRLVSRAFATIDVRVKWKPGVACQAGGVHAYLWLETPPALNPGALGRSFPRDGTRIDVFYDRVRAAVPAPFVPSVLAHVFVHELAHVASASDAHTEAGLMKARWDAPELLDMHRKPLGFSKADVTSIHQGLANRAARLGARGTESNKSGRN